MSTLLESPELRDVPDMDVGPKPPLPAAVVADKRPLTVEPPEQPISFDQWQATVAANFPAYARPAEICASVVVQLLLNDVANPFALALVDVPSSGKTITLNFFDVPVLAYTTDNFTPASFVSHASNVKREELAKVDMLPRIRYRTLIVRDLAPIFGVKEDELLKTMGILTRALDGEGLETDSGVHGKRGYTGDWLFMLLAGTTPIPPRVFKVMGTLGSRLFFLALHPNTKSHDELIAQNRGTARREKERACREATDLFLRTLWTANPGGVEWNKVGDPDDCLRVIARCAELLAALRGAIQVWPSEHDSSMNHNVPVIEQPDRINCLLYNLARGHALLCGRTQLATADLAPVLEVTFDSAPTIRSKVFRGLLEQGGTLKTSQVEKLLRCSKPTALREMEALAVLGVADKTEADPEYGRPEHELRLAEKFEWFATAERKALCWPSKQAQGGNP
jgi:predicted transcriptional regulator